MRRPLTAAERADVERVAPLVRSIVGQRARTIPRWIDLGDVLQAAMEAVCVARPRWRPDGGASWSTYAVFRAQGAITDYLRSSQEGTRHNPMPAPVSLNELVHGDRDGEQHEVSRQELLVAPEVDHLGSHETLRRIGAVIDQLPESQARSFRACVLNNMTLVKHALDEGVTESAISFRLRRARARIDELAAVR